VRGTCWDARPAPATVGDRAMQALVVAALVLAVAFVYVRLLVLLLELVTRPLR
jgi:hypothetical protein